MATETILALWGAVGTLSAIIFAIVAFLRNKRSDDTRSGKDAGAVMTELGYIKSGMDETKAMLRDLTEKNMTTQIELAEVKRDVKSAHRRIDAIEKNVPRSWDSDDVK